MAATGEATDRHVVPRWPLFRDALATGELAPGAIGEAQSIDGSAFIKEKEIAWLENKHLPFAVDLISAATIFGSTPTATQAATFVLESGDRSSALAQTLAKGILGIQPDSEPVPQLQSRIQIIANVKELKTKRINQPRNAFVWIDLARLYVLLGENEAAQHALKVAIALAPTNRFIVRCGARFLHHIKDHEAALELLRKNHRTPFDSWLVAAEIAASSAADKTPKFAKLGGTLLNKGDVLPFHTSELASALGHLEMTAGNDRRANKLFTQSLRQPTDNSLAQIVWASKRLGLGGVNQQVLENANASEALTWADYNRGDWKGVVKRAEEWAEQEGFSTRPLLLASSTAASFLDEFDLAEQIARRGLIANPGHPTLLNNVAFAMIQGGNPAEALRLIKGLKRDTIGLREAIFLDATTGLAYFRLGQPDVGQRYYETAIATAKSANEEGLRIIASMYYAREKAFRRDETGVKDFRRIYDLAQKLQRTHVPALASHLSKDVEKIAVSLGLPPKPEVPLKPFIAEPPLL